MSRPKIELPNHKEMYRWYGQRRPNPRVAKVAHYALGRALNPRYRYARGAREQLGDHFGKGGLVLMAANHRGTLDPLHLASWVQRDGVMHPLIGKVVIAAKPDIYRDPKYRWLRAPLFDEFLVVPAPRKKDIPTEMARSGLTRQAAEALQDEAKAEMTGVLIDCANDGNNIVLFVDGERKQRRTTDSPEEDKKIKAGIGYLAMGIEARERFAILPIGVDYDSNNKGHLYIGNLLPLADSVPEVVSETQLAVRECEALAAVAAH